jgi:hypothetical protein
LELEVRQKTQMMDGNYTSRGIWTRLAVLVAIAIPLIVVGYDVHFVEQSA